MKASIMIWLGCFALGACTASAPPRAPASPRAADGDVATATGDGSGAHDHGAMGHGMGAAAMGHGMGAGMGAQMMSHGAMAECPMHLEGVTVKADDVEGGAALVFSTSGDVEELRRRVKRMAEMHAKHAGKECPMMSAAGPAASKTPPAPSN